MTPEIAADEILRRFSPDKMVADEDVTFLLNTIRAAVAAERARCAEIAHGFMRFYEQKVTEGQPGADHGYVMAKRMAAAIEREG